MSIVLANNLTLGYGVLMNSEDIMNTTKQIIDITDRYASSIADNTPYSKRDAAARNRYIQEAVALRGCDDTAVAAYLYRAWDDAVRAAARAATETLQHSMIQMACQAAEAMALQRYL